MGLILLWSVLLLATLAWLVVGVWKSSRGWAIATLVLGPLGALVPLVRERHHPDTRVTAPFLVHLAFTVLWVISVTTAVQRAWREEAAQQAQAQAQAQAETAQPSSAPAAATGEDGLPRDPVGRFSNQMSAAGLRHALEPVDNERERPRGALQALRLTVGAPAGDARELKGWLLRCADGRSCQRLAGSFKASAPRGESAPQVTQNGMMLLVMPTSVESEGLHHVVQGVFRRTPFEPT